MIVISPAVLQVKISAPDLETDTATTEKKKSQVTTAFNSRKHQQSLETILQYSDKKLCPCPSDICQEWCPTLRSK